MDYVEFDEFGLKELRCMNCKIPIAGRTYITLPSRSEPGKTENVLAMSRYANHKQVGVNLSDGTYAELPVCSECALKPALDVLELSNQLLAGWELELFAAGKSRSDVAEMKWAKRRLKVKGKGA